MAQQMQQRLLQEQQKQQQLDKAALQAAAKAATAPDTFKRGDALAGGRCVEQGSRSTDSIRCY
jgi:hypothetical protein